MNSSDKLRNKAIVVVAGTNATDTLDACLDSLVTQDYPDLGIIFVDGHSDDDTLEKAKSKLKDRRDSLVISHLQYRGRLICWKSAIKDFCSDPASVIFLVNPEDRLLGNNAISTMMRHHVEYDVVCEGNLNVRREIWKPSRFLSFKKFLFDAIGPVDFLDRNGRPLTYAEDMAVMLPVTEMAGRERCYVLESEFYHRLDKEKNRNAVTMQALCEIEIRNKRPYGIWQSVTFIVPCHNQGNELEEGIAPLIGQNVLLKVIIVNAGSTDDTQEVCERIAKKYPTIVSCLRMEGSNIPAAKNAGAKAAKSNFIVPFSLGDSISHMWLSGCFFAMNRGVDVVYTSYCDKTTGKTSVAYIVEDDLKKSGMIPNCCLMRKEMWEKLNGWLECEDEKASNLDFWLRGLKKKFVFERCDIPVMIPQTANIRIDTESHNVEVTPLRRANVVGVSVVVVTTGTALELALESCYYQSLPPLKVVIAYSGNKDEIKGVLDGALLKYPFNIALSCEEGDMELAIGKAITMIEGGRILFVTQNQIYGSSALMAHFGVLDYSIGIGPKMKLSKEIASRIKKYDIPNIDALVVAGSSDSRMWSFAPDTSEMDLLKGNISIHRDMCQHVFNANGRADNRLMVSRFTERNVKVTWMNNAVAYLAGEL